MDARGWKVFSGRIQTVPMERVTVFINAKSIETCFLFVLRGKYFL